jgi:hypothetical protein
MHHFSSMDVVLAYFDPGSGSLLLQMVLGGSAGLLVFAKYLWDRALLRRRKPATVKVEAERPAPRG